MVKEMEKTINARLLVLEKKVEVLEGNNLLKEDLVFENSYKTESTKEASEVADMRNG